MWETSRATFFTKEPHWGEQVCIPVVSRKGELLCFAYEDGAANKEIRMLRELSGHKQWLNFRDVYQECDCVILDGCNELAFFFHEYLSEIDVPVKVLGGLWHELGIASDKAEYLDYRTVTIYCEGREKIANNIQERVLRSVSVEFECIDKIYEENIKAGYITNASGDYKELINKIRGKKIVLMGEDRDMLNTYDLLFSSGIDILAFCDEKKNQKRKTILGKPVLRLVEIEKKWKADKVYIDCSACYSAWGFGWIDCLDYLGYHRNKSSFMIRDYVLALENSLSHVLKGKRIILTGDLFLCHRLMRYLSAKIHAAVIRYVSIVDFEGYSFADMEKLSVDEIDDEDMVFLVMPDSYAGKNVSCEKKKNMYTILESHGIVNVCDYFSWSEVSLDQDYYDKQFNKKRKNLCVKGIVINVSNHGCGNTLINDILDNHPSILMFSEGMGFGAWLYWLCVRLAEIEPDQILDVFWNLYEHECADEVKILRGKEKEFSEELMYFLSVFSDLSSQDLFIIFHIAYNRLWNKQQQNNNDMIIYWYPHDLRLSVRKEIYKWLGGENQNIKGYMLKLVRRSDIRTGSVIGFIKAKNLLNISNVMQHSRQVLLEPISYNRSDNVIDGMKWGKIEIKFEDLKTSPNEILHEFCKRVDIEWSDCLLETTCHGEKSFFQEITGFDLKPVYNLHEEHLSEFDRMRIMILNANYQKKYGYPYIEQSNFSRHELQEMFLKNYKFEFELPFSGNVDYLNWKLNVKRWVDERLWYERRNKILSEK